MEGSDKKVQKRLVLLRASERVAVMLGETEEGAKLQILRILHQLGLETVTRLLRETLRIEQNGGLSRTDGKRRTTGGVFFQVVRNHYPALQFGFKKKKKPVSSK